MEDPDIHLADKATKRSSSCRRSARKGSTETTFEKIALAPRPSIRAGRQSAWCSNKATLAKLSDDPTPRFVRPRQRASMIPRCWRSWLAIQNPCAGAAINRISDTTLLQKLADSDPEGYIQKAAARRLEALKGRRSDI